MRTTERHPGVVSITLEPHEQSAFSNEVQDIPDISGFTEASFLDELQKRGQALRSRVTQVVDFLAEMSTHRGVSVAIFDLGEDTVRDIGSTPTDYKIPDGKQNLFRADMYRGLLVSLVDWYGYGFTTQQDGLIHNNIVPVEEHAETLGHSGNAKYELGLHVEDASFNLGPDLNISPDFLTLHFFRNQKKVPTILATADWTNISAKTRDLLSGEWYYNKTNPLQGGPKNDPSKPVSVIYGPDDDPWIRLNTSRLNLEAYNPEQVDALTELTEHLNARRMHIGATSGQILVFDNRRVLHGRAPYSEEDYPRYDGTDRWQRRLTVACDISRIQEFEISRRVVDPVKLLQKAARTS